MRVLHKRAEDVAVTRLVAVIRLRMTATRRISVWPQLNGGRRR